jgi:predicted Zn-dependent peptidase
MRKYSVKNKLYLCCLLFSLQAICLFSEKIVLENGLTAIYEKDISSKVSVFQIFIKGGKRAEPEGKAGLAYLTTRLAIEIPDQNKLQALMDQATHLYIACTEEYSLVTIASLSENLEDTLKITSQILGKPLFSNIRIERIKEQMTRSRKMELDEPVIAAHYAFADIFMAGTPFAGQIYGSETSLISIKKKDIISFYENHFLTGNMVFSISTDLEKQTIMDLIKKFFGDFHAGKLPGPKLLSFSPISKEKEQFIDKDSTQAHISAGYLLPQLSPRNYLLAYLATNLLGKGVGSRLWPLRSEKKLAYNVYSRATYFSAGGILEAFIETENTKQDTALDSFIRVLDELYSEGVTEEELNMTKSYSKALFLRNNETKESRALTRGNFEIIGLGCSYFEKFINEINTVSAEEINTFIRKVLAPEKRVQVIIGPKKEPSLH